MDSPKTVTVNFSKANTTMSTGDGVPWAIVGSVIGGVVFVGIAGYLIERRRKPTTSPMSTGESG